MSSHSLTWEDAERLQRASHRSSSESMREMLGLPSGASIAAYLPSLLLCAPSTGRPDVRRATRPLGRVDCSSALLLGEPQPPPPPEPQTVELEQLNPPRGRAGGREDEQPGGVGRRAVTPAAAPAARPPRALAGLATQAQERPAREQAWVPALSPHARSPSPPTFAPAAPSPEPPWAAVDGPEPQPPPESPLGEASTPPVPRSLSRPSPLFFSLFVPF